MRILGFGTYDLALHPRAGVILDGLRAHGNDVVEVNEPLGFSTAERLAMLRRPYRAYRLVLRLLRRWLSLAARARRARRDSGFDAVLVGYLGQFDVLLARLLFPRSLVILDQMTFGVETARDRRVGGWFRLQLLRGLDRIAIGSADLVVVDTTEHLELIPEPTRHKGMVLDVGASAPWFAAGEHAAGESPVLRVVFFGLYTPLQGAEIIGSALGRLAARADIEATMIGRGQDYAATRRAAAANTHVRWIDWVDAAELPATVAAHDVCLGIFGATAKALRVVPNKVYQGAAAGCAIVTAWTGPQLRALGPAACFVPPGDADSLATALRELADDRGRLRQLREMAHATALERFGAAEIVKPLLGWLDAASGTPRQPRGPRTPRGPRVPR